MSAAWTFCGGSTHFLGHKTSFVSKVDVSTSRVDELGFIVDSLGVRSVRFGGSPWSSGDPKSVKCWEGFSRRRAAKTFRVVRDVSETVRILR